MESPDLENRLRSLSRRRPIGGKYYWRCIETDHAWTALESGPNFQNPSSRYSVPKTFSALYLSSSERLAVAEKKSKSPQGPNLSILKLRLSSDLPGAVDLTDPDTLLRLKIDSEKLKLTREQPGAFDEPRRVARAAFKLKIPVLLVPSRIPKKPEEADWHNLVAYPALLADRFFKLVDSHPL